MGKVPNRKAVMPYRASGFMDKIYAQGTHTGCCKLSRPLHFVSVLVVIISITQIKHCRGDPSGWSSSSLRSAWAGRPCHQE